MLEDKINIKKRKRERKADCGGPDIEREEENNGVVKITTCAKMYLVLCGCMVCAC
jgi:hypothetical protein